MSFTPKQIDDLSAPLSSRHVKERSQAGQKLSYIEAWHAISEANRIFGFDGWHSTTRLKKLFEPYKDGKDKWRVGFMAKVTIGVKDGERCVTRDGVGYGSGIDNDIGQAHEKAIKEAESDARKRALMTFGNPFGLALYDKEQANVSDDAPVSAVSVPAVPAVPPRNASGISEARSWVRDHIRELESCEDGVHLMATLAPATPRWTKICGVYPNLWTGPDGSGLKGEGIRISTIFQCRAEFDKFVKQIEAAAAEIQTPKVAAQ